MPGASRQDPRSPRLWGFCLASIAHFQLFESLSLPEVRASAAASEVTSALQPHPNLLLQPHPSLHLLIAQRQSIAQPAIELT